MTKRLMGALLLLTVIPLIAGAQTPAETHRRWEFGLFGATSTSGGITTLTMSTTQGQAYKQVEMKFATGSELGARVTENLGQHWAATLEYGFSNQPITLNGLSSITPTFHVSQSVHRISYDVLYLPRTRNERLRPFAFAGPGVALFYVHKNTRTLASAQNMNLSSPWKATFNWGGGAKYLFKNRLAAVAQITDTISSIPRYGLPRAAWSFSGNVYPGFNPSGLMHNWRMGIGIVYEWDDF